MATEKDLINAVRESLKVDGKLGHIKAEMRNEITKLLDGTSKDDKLKGLKPPQEVILLNELIREYLDWMGYKYSSTVFTAECDLPKQPIDRSLIVQSLGVKENEKIKALPLLCSLIETFQKMTNT